MHHVTAESLRIIVEQAMAVTIENHRESRAAQDDPQYARPVGPPTPEEVDDFLFHNPLLDEETVEQLTDPGLLGFAAKTAKATDEWMVDFNEAIDSWTKNQSWLGADQSFRRLVPEYDPDESEIWTPASAKCAAWLANAPTYVVLAADLIRSGRLLSELSWRDFERLIAALLETDGWAVAVTQMTRDGGIDVVATKDDPILGVLRSVWQAKKYKSSNKVKLREVRELSAIREDARATKGFIVTTSSLTRDAIAWVKRDLYRLGYKEHDHVKEWLEGTFLR